MNISTLKEVKFIVKMWKHFSILAAMLYLLPSASGYNYCHNKSHVCRQRNLDHFMCNLGNLRPLDGTVKYEDIMPDAPKLRDNILGKLNRYRNNLAGGDIRTAYNKSFPKASRMRALAWDEELGYLARCHAKTVSFMHSECRATSRFPYAGEVLAMIGVQKKKLFLWEIINLTLKPMFEEHMLVEDPEEYVKNYDPIKHYGVGHFTTIISDRVSRVGCGIAVGSNCYHGPKVGTCHFLTCMFDFTNIANSFVYKPGKPASECDVWHTRRSNSYGHLCKHTENTGFDLVHDHWN
ncbi:uncharacterized protein Dana_GF13477, isoform E [Drosophila ananassae]|uniref:Uncharacterized protein, isoform E n=1 Tax=Drosophila ananassae TaxID=7217 RepID=A0A0P9C001_DROAN|nr:antigen 5 like allergen Cul n 1 [Drosophila ananassae]XP_032307018.1 antigen 5 like allergen Cul n 1 [Drosophila ananassae]KPU76871.1 uncharacterized protein Dana_GF13477, isoform E [Drosophila ananassae]